MYKLENKRKFESASQFINRMNREKRQREYEEEESIRSIWAVVGIVIFGGFGILATVIDSLPW